MFAHMLDENARLLGPLRAFDITTDTFHQPFERVVTARVAVGGDRPRPFPTFRVIHETDLEVPSEENTEARVAPTLADDATPPGAADRVMCPHARMALRFVVATGAPPSRLPAVSSVTVELCAPNSLAPLQLCTPIRTRGGIVRLVADGGHVIVTPTMGGAMVERVRSDAMLGDAEVAEGATAFVREAARVAAEVRPS